MSSTLTMEPPVERKASSSKATPNANATRQIRRTRDANPAKRRGTPTMMSNGRDTSTGGVNGHGSASTSGTTQETPAPCESDKAASDDARDFPSAVAASSAVAGTERDACAEVAKPKEETAAQQPKPARIKTGPKASRVPSETPGKAAKKKEKMVDIPPGSEPLPEDGVGFVDAMHAHVDIYLACARLVKSGDEKIAQRMVERLLEMSYGKSPTVSDEVPQIIFDAPRPLSE